MIIELSQELSVFVIFRVVEIADDDWKKLSNCNFDKDKNDSHGNGEGVLL